MRLTVIDAAEASVEARVEGSRVLVGSDGLVEATGWSLRPEGLCRGPVCVPVRELIETDDGIDLGAVAQLLGRAFVLEPEADVAALAGDPMSTGSTASIDDLELPDLDGRPTRMADTAGRKRVLIAWASW